MHQAESANPKNTRNFYRVFDESGYTGAAPNSRQPIAAERFSERIADAQPGNRPRVGGVQSSVLEIALGTDHEPVIDLIIAPALTAARKTRRGHGRGRPSSDNRT
jgi:hypothetical protein